MDHNPIAKSPTDIRHVDGVEKGQERDECGVGRNHHQNMNRGGDCLTETSCLADFLQKKYKCLIIYAFSIIAVVELFMILYNGENSTSGSIMDVMSRYLNRTQTLM